jgi:hypothetical protein
MKFFKVFKVVMGVAMAIAGDVLEAWEDGVLDGKELGTIISKGIMGLRMTGVSQDELDQILIISTKMEYDMLPFKDGDLVIYGPSELTSKMKIKV